MNIHSDIHSVFKVFRAFYLDHVVLQLLQGSKMPLVTFLGGSSMFILPIDLFTFNTIYQRLYKHRLYAVTFDV